MIPMTFNELTSHCTPEQREAMALHLAVMRGIKTFLELRRAPADESKPLVSEEAWNALWRLQFGDDLKPPATTPGGEEVG
jgi:hypothetical protein